MVVYAQVLHESHSVVLLQRHVSVRAHVMTSPTACCAAQSAGRSPLTRSPGAPSARN